MAARCRCDVGGLGSLGEDGVSAACWALCLRLLPGPGAVKLLLESLGLSCCTSCCLLVLEGCQLSDLLRSPALA